MNIIYHYCPIKKTNLSHHELILPLNLSNQENGGDDVGMAGSAGSGGGDGRTVDGGLEDDPARVCFSTPGGGVLLGAGVVEEVGEEEDASDEDDDDNADETLARRTTPPDGVQILSPIAAAPVAGAHHS